MRSRLRWRRYRGFFDLSRLDPKHRQIARTVLSNAYPGFNWRRLKKVLAGRRIWIMMDPAIAAPAAWNPNIDRGQYPAPPGYGVKMRTWGAEVVNDHAVLWHELGHIVDHLWMTHEKRERVRDVLCQHEPQHEWFDDEDRTRFTQYPDRVGEAFGWAFQEAFANNLGGDGGRGWIHEPTTESSALVREVLA